MKRLALLFACALVAIAGSARAETCTISTATEILWSSVTQNVASCTEDANDDFVVPSGARVRVTANIVGNAGSLTIQSGAYFSVDPGVTVEFGGKNTVSGSAANFVAKGRVVATSRIKSISRTGRNAADVTLEDDFANQVNPTTDFLVVYDEDPTNPDETLNGKTVQIGPGTPSRGDHMPAPGKYKWLDITNDAGGVLTVDPDYYATGLGMTAIVSNVFQGNRGYALTTPTAVTSITPNQYQNVSTILIPDAGDAIVITRADLTDQFVEITTGPCAGFQAKILDSIDNGAGTDASIIVAGDMTRMPLPGARLDLNGDGDFGDTGENGGFLACGATPSVIIHDGIRAGQVVKIVRPVTFDGYDGAGTAPTDNTGSWAFTNGNVEMEWVRFIRMGYRDAATDFTPSLNRNCVLCFVAENASAVLTGYLRNFEVGYMSPASTDTGALEFSALDANGSARFATPFNLANFPISRGYIHDQARDQSGGLTGAHGIYVDSAAGLDIRRIRVERLADDLYGDFMTTIGGTITPSVKVRHFIGAAQLPTTGTSAQGFEPSSPAYGIGTGQEIVRTANAYTYQDIFITGGADNSLASNNLQSIHRIVAAGGHTSGQILYGNLPLTTTAAFKCTGNGVPVACCTGSGTGATCSVPTTGLTVDPGLVVEDAFLASFGPGTSNGRIWVGGTLRNAIAINSSDSGSNGDNLIAGLDGVFLYGMTSIRAFSMATSAGRTSMTIPTFTVNSSAIMSPALLFFGQYYPDHGSAFVGMTRFNATRLYLGVNDITGTHGVFTGFNDAGASYPVTFTVDGMNLAATTPDANTVGAGQAQVEADSTFTHVCAETNAVRNTASSFGTSPDSTDLAAGTVGPDPGTSGTPIPAKLADFLSDPMDPDPCIAYRPNRLGIQNVGTEFPLLGDFVVAQFDRWSSNPDAIRVRVSGRGSALSFTGN